MTTENSHCAISGSFFERVSSLYNLPKPVLGKRLNGFSCENYLLFSGQDKFILKKIEVGSVNRFVHQPEITQALSSSGIPVPSFLLNNEKSYFFQDNEGSYFTLLKALEGHVLHGNDLGTPSLQSVASTLAKFHDCSVPNFSKVNEKDISGKAIKNQQKFVLKELSDSALRNRLLKILTRKIQFLESMFISDHSDSNQPFYLTHGDFHNENVLFNQQKEVSGILDFEDVHLGDGLYDVFHFLRLLVGEDLVNDGGMKRAKIFFNGYRNAINSKIELKNSFSNYLMIQGNSIFFENLFLHTGDFSYLKLAERDIATLELYEARKEIILQDLLRSDG